MDRQRRVWLLILVMVVVVVGVETVALTALYRTSFREEQDRMANIVQSQARLFEAVAQFDRVESLDYPGGPLQATLAQFQAATARMHRPGGTVELTLARRVGDSIVFLLRQGAGEPLAPLSMPLTGPLAEPQIQALAGVSGVMVGLDHRGRRVMAAYEGVGVYDLGMVAKIDLAEIRSPFVRSGLLAGAVGLALIALGSVVVLRVTEPLLAEVRRSEVRHRDLAHELEAVFQASPLPLFALDKDGRVNRWNPAAERTFGWTEEEVMGQALPLVPPEKTEEFRGLREGILSGTPVTGLELERRRKDGSPVDVRLFSDAIRSASGAATGLVAVLEDITAEKAAARISHERKTLLEGIINNLPRGIVHVLDRDFRYRFNAGEEMERLGLTNEALVGKSIHEVLGPELAYRVESEYRKALGGETVRFEGEFGGEWFMVTATPIRAPNGDVDRILALSLNITDRVRTEGALRESEERYRSVVENSPLAIGVIQDERLVFANAVAAELLGAADRRELTDRPISEIVAPGGLGRARDRMERTLAGEEVRYPVEDRYLRLDGLEVPVEVTAAPFVFNGRPAIQVMAQDLTEWNEMERALRASEERYRSLFLNSHAVMLVVDPQSGQILDANPRALAYYGFSRTELLSSTVFDLNQAPEEQVWEAMREVAAHRKGNFRFHHRLADGRVRTVDVYSGPIRLPEGERLLSIVHDVTEQARTQEELARQKALVQAVLDHAPVMIAVTDPEGNWILANEALQDTLGWSFEEIRGHPDLMGALYPDPADRARIFEVISAGTGEWDDYQTRTRDGRVLETTWANVRLHDGSSVGMGQDITDRKKMEEKLRAWAAEMEIRVKERTADLQAANRELEAFSYTVSHDLKAPLRAIDGFSRILEVDYGPVLDDEGHRVLDTVRSNTRRMAQLIDDLLAFSRLGRTALRRDLVDMKATAGAALEDLSGQMEGRRVEVVVEDLPSVSGDRRLLRQVFLNLLGNAVKFTGTRDAAEIRVAGALEGKEAVFRVEDNGVGFDPTYAHKLFGVFQRLHHLDEFPGTGVGLANVRRIVERHGGRAWAEGKPGQGATFYFSLPLEARETE